jgi:hypothetical protein
MQHVTDKHAINTSQPPMNKHDVIHHCFLEHDVVMFGRNLAKLRRNVLPSSSGTSWLNFTKFQRSLPPRFSSWGSKEDAVDTYKMPTEIYQTTLLHIPEDSKFHSHKCENFSQTTNEFLSF